MHPLASYLREQLPRGMKYDDATHLCMRLFCTVDGVPSELCPLTKECIGDSFAALASIGWVLDYDKQLLPRFGPGFHQVTDRGHWIEVIASMFRNGSAKFDIERGEQLAKLVGF